MIFADFRAKCICMGIAAECDGDIRGLSGITEKWWNTIEIGGFGARNTDYCILKGKSLRNRSIRFQSILSSISAHLVEMR